MDEAYADQYFDKVCKECSGVSAELTFYCYFFSQSTAYTDKQNEFCTPDLPI